MWLKQNYRMWGNFLQTLCFKLNSLKGKTRITSWSSSWAEAPRQSELSTSPQVKNVLCEVTVAPTSDLWPPTSVFSSVHPPVTEDKGARVNTTSGQCLHSASVVFSVQQLQAEWEIKSFSDSLILYLMSREVSQCSGSNHRDDKQPHFWL